MKTLIAAAALALTAAPALANEIVLEEAMAGATLHQSGVDMSVYWTEAEAGYEVVATFLPQMADAAPARLIMTLAEGDDVSFGLPGTLTHTYTFARTEAGVTVAAEPVGLQYASN